MQWAYRGSSARCGDNEDCISVHGETTALADWRAHLREATGLEQRRHADDVAGGVDQVAQRLVIAEAEGRVLASQRARQGVELRLPCGLACGQLGWRQHADYADQYMTVCCAADASAAGRDSKAHSCQLFDMLSHTVMTQRVPTATAVSALPVWQLPKGAAFAWRPDIRYGSQSYLDLRVGRAAQQYELAAPVQCAPRCVLHQRDACIGDRAHLRHLS